MTYRNLSNRDFRMCFDCTRCSCIHHFDNRKKDSMRKSKMMMGRTLMDKTCLLVRHPMVAKNYKNKIEDFQKDLPKSYRWWTYQLDHGLKLPSLKAWKKSLRRDSSLRWNERAESNAIKSESAVFIVLESGLMPMWEIGGFGDLQFVVYVYCGTVNLTFLHFAIIIIKI